MTAHPFRGFTAAAAFFLLLICSHAANTQSLSFTHSCTAFGKTDRWTFENEPQAHVSLGYEQYGGGKADCTSLVSRHTSQVVFGGWDQGFGGDDPCNTKLPFNKTLRAFEALRVSMSLPSAPLTQQQLVFLAAVAQNKTAIAMLNFLTKAYSESTGAFTSVNATCMVDASNSISARFLGKTNGLGIGPVTLYHNVFDEHVILLASLLVHEARHSVKDHNGGDKCPHKQSCDSDINFAGANASELSWLVSYSMLATKTQPRLRTFALDYAKIVANRAFVTNPQINFPATVPELPHGW